MSQVATQLDKSFVDGSGAGSALRAASTHSEFRDAVWLTFVRGFVEEGSRTPTNDEFFTQAGSRPLYTFFFGTDFRSRAKKAHRISPSLLFQFGIRFQVKTFRIPQQGTNAGFHEADKVKCATTMTGETSTSSRRCTVD